MRGRKVVLGAQSTRILLEPPNFDYRGQSLFATEYLDYMGLLRETTYHFDHCGETVFSEVVLDAQKGGVMLGCPGRIVLNIHSIVCTACHTSIAQDVIGDGFSMFVPIGAGGEPPRAIREMMKLEGEEIWTDEVAEKRIQLGSKGTLWAAENMIWADNHIGGVFEPHETVSSQIKEHARECDDISSFIKTGGRDLWYQASYELSEIGCRCGWVLSHKTGKFTVRFSCYWEDHALRKLQIMAMMEA